MIDFIDQYGAGDQIVIMEEVCLNKRLEFSAAPQQIIDFTILKVFNKNKSNTVGVYVGLHPDIGIENRKYNEEEFRLKLRKPIRMQLKNGEIIGIQNTRFGYYFHIYSRNTNDVNWVSKYVNFCSQLKKKSKNP